MNTKTLALYLGCEAELRTSSGYLQISKLNDVDLRDNTVVVGDEWGDAFNVRLRLRPLSSMTEEEANELQGKLGWIGCPKDQMLRTFTDDLPEYFSTSIKASNWLRSKSFDCDGLIKEGEALDSTSQPEGGTVQ